MVGLVDRPPPPKLEWSWKDVVWPTAIFFIFLHVQLPYSIYVLFYETSLITFLWALFVTVYGGMGVTVGAHRLWSHRSFKATKAFHYFAMLCFSSNFQDDVITWVITHRTHHRYSDTDADPHDSRRGFFYSHMGWLLIRPGPAVTAARASIDVRDLLANPALVFNRKYVYPLSFLLTFLIPTMTPLLWGERFMVSYHVVFIFRYTYTLHMAFTVNSLAHAFGTKPYDRNLGARQNALVTFLTTGEGWHNYHHAFPYDYRASEFPWLYNLSTMIIDFMSKLGCVYEMRVAPQSTIDERKQRTGNIE